MSDLRAQLAEVFRAASVVVREAAEASNAEMAALIASAALPGQGLPADLQAQRDALARLERRIRDEHLAAVEGDAALSRRRARAMLADLRAVLHAVRVAVYDLLNYGEVGGLGGADVLDAARRLVALDARLRELVIPQLRREYADP
jgi:hypothetical protein